VEKKVLAKKHIKCKTQSKHDTNPSEVRRFPEAAIYRENLIKKFQDKPPRERNRTVELIVMEYLHRQNKCSNMDLLKEIDRLGKKTRTSQTTMAVISKRIYNQLGPQTENDTSAILTRERFISKRYSGFMYTINQAIMKKLTPSGWLTIVDEMKKWKKKPSDQEPIVQETTQEAVTQEPVQETTQEAVTQESVQETTQETVTQEPVQETVNREIVQEPTIQEQPVQELLAQETTNLLSNELIIEKIKAVRELIDLMPRGSQIIIDTNGRVTFHF
jgi:hypothetical protein